VPGRRFSGGPAASRLPVDGAVPCGAPVDSRIVEAALECSAVAPGRLLRHRMRQFEAVRTSLPTAWGRVGKLPSRIDLRTPSRNFEAYCLNCRIAVLRVTAVRLGEPLAKWLVILPNFDADWFLGDGGRG